VPEPISARVTPSRCPRAGEAASMQIFGFLANARFEYRATGPSGARSAPLTGGHVDERGELTGIQFPAGSLAPGRWRFDFTFLGPNDQPVYSASVDLRVEP
jgi:hypothetical protein